ncbi:MAG: alpha/beta hydrolase [Austwickia sp.]|jgi:haloacetate dehalogenase|nr:MAG: alpha/beta hydrolase [Austwickia sp.]
MFEGFREIDVEVPGALIHARVGGAPEGAPVLLLHGYPQTHAMWHRAAAELATTYAVVAADLRGYGDSITHETDYTFRAMAADQVALMRALGHERFHVIAHDRGARTAHRMVLDSADAVASVALLDILPTLDVWAQMDAWLAMKYYHWPFLAQPGGMPERLIGSDPVGYLRDALGGLSGPLDVFDPGALAAYEQAARKPSVVAAWCGDYRAGATIDLDHDRADEGRTADLPALLLWGTKGVVGAQVDPLACWRRWFPNVTGYGVPAGHFLVEEAPDLVIPALREHLAGVTACG